MFSFDAGSPFCAKLRSIFPAVVWLGREGKPRQSDFSGKHFSRNRAPARLGMEIRSPDKPKFPNLGANPTYSDLRDRIDLRFMFMVWTCLGGQDNGVRRNWPIIFGMAAIGIPAKIKQKRDRRDRDRKLNQHRITNGRNWSGGN